MSASTPKKTPRYEQIASALTGEIRTAALKPHAFFITLDEICERFETSRITAQRAILEMAKRGVVYTKRGNGAYVAPHYDKPRSGLIGIVFNSFVEDGALPLVINGAEAHARKLKYNVILCNAQADLRLNQEYVTRLIDQKVDGVLLELPLDEQQSGPLHDLIYQLEAQRIPVVLIQKRFLDESEPTAYVVTDNYGGTLAAIEHLCNLGHRRIAGIFELYNSGGIERLEGYRGAILKLGGAYMPDLVKSINKIEECDAAVDELFRLPKLPTAIFCIHDLVARRVIQLVQAKGMRVPEDVAIVGFDDLPFSHCLSPRLTTVRQPLEKLGHEAMGILFHRMTEDFDYRPQVRLPTRLIVRESCGAGLVRQPQNQVDGPSGLAAHAPLARGAGR